MDRLAIRRPRPASGRDAVRSPEADPPGALRCPGAAADAARLFPRGSVTTGCRTIRIAPDPRHNMNAAIMWFVLSAFAEACIRLEISGEFRVVLHARNPPPAAERRPVPGAPDGAGIQGDARRTAAVFSTPRPRPTPTCRPNCGGGP